MNRHEETTPDLVCLRRRPGVQSYSNWPIEKEELEKGR